MPDGNTMHDASEASITASAPSRMLGRRHRSLITPPTIELADARNATKTRSDRISGSERNSDWTLGMLGESVRGKSPAARRASAAAMSTSRLRRSPTTSRTNGGSLIGLTDLSAASPRYASPDTGWWRLEYRSPDGRIDVAGMCRDLAAWPVRCRACQPAYR